MPDDLRYIRPAESVSPTLLRLLAQRYAVVRGPAAAQGFSDLFDQVFFEVEGALGEMTWEAKVETVTRWWEDRLGIRRLSLNSAW